MVRDPGRRPRRAVRRATAALLLMGALALVLSGCATNNPQTTLDPQGPVARQIYDLFVVWIFWPAVLVFLAVEGLLLYSVFRFRGRPGDPLPAQLHGNTRLEITWTLIPALILVAILAVTFRTQAALATPPQGEIIHIQVVGHQWWWEFTYLDQGFTTANEMHIPVGVPVTVEITSNDVIHSYWVPHLAGKRDAIPGRINTLTFSADAAGVYSGQCSEFCGIEHALMRMQVIAESRSQFDAWAQNQRAIPAYAAPPATPTAGAATGTPVPPTPTAAPAGGAATATPGVDQSLVAQGAQLFANGACITCHTLRGTPANAKVGPDLTHVGSRQTIAAATLPNTPDNLKRWLRNPQAVKPGNDMPNLNLSDADIDALAAYLGSLK